MKKRVVSFGLTIIAVVVMYVLAVASFLIPAPVKAENLNENSQNNAGITSNSNIGSNGTIDITNYSARIGDIYYADLNLAFAGAVAGDVIELVKDVTLTEQIKVTNQAVLSDVTINGNGYTISADFDQTKSVLYFGDSSTGAWATGVKINDLTIDANARFGIALIGGTTSVLNNVKVSGNYLYGVNLYGTHGATMTDCYIETTLFTNGQDDNKLILENTYVKTLLANSSQSVLDAGKVIIDENSTVDTLKFWGDSTIMIESGMEKVNKVVSAEGKTLYARTQDHYYADAELAFKQLAEDGGDLTLLEDCALNGVVEINSKATIDLNGNDLVLPAISNDYAIVVNNSLEISGTGNVIVEGEYGIKAATFCTDYLYIDGGNYVRATSTGNIFAGNKVKISGGKFNQEIPEKYWAKGYVVVEENGIYDTITIKEYQISMLEQLKIVAKSYVDSGEYNQEGVNKFVKLLEEAEADVFANTFFMAEVDQMIEKYVEKFDFVYDVYAQEQAVLEAIVEVRNYAAINNVDANSSEVQKAIANVNEQATATDIQLAILSAYDVIDKLADKNVVADKLVAQEKLLNEIIVIEAFIAIVVFIILLLIVGLRRKNANDGAIQKQPTSAGETEVVATEQEDLTDDELSSEIDGGLVINGESKTFEEKLAVAEPIVKEGYETIREKLLSYKKINARVSKKAVSFRFGRKLLCKLTIRGKTLRAYLALNPNAYEVSKFFQKDASDVKAYAEVPMLMRVRSARAIKRVCTLIEDLEKDNQLVAKPQPKA